MIHSVRENECITSVAAKYGLNWETIWNDPANAELKSERESPNLLVPGDQITVPELRLREESCTTSERHRFVKKGVPAKLRLRLTDDGQPRSGEPYRLRVDGRTTSGTVPEGGLLELHIAPNANHATLLVGDEPDEYVLKVGVIQPVSELKGVQARLDSLGYPCGRPDGELGPKTQSALIGFQRTEELEETGEPDQATLNLLRERYGC